MSYEVEIIRKKTINDEKAIITLEKPEGYCHKPGEHLKVKIGDDERHYSIGSEPESERITLYLKQLEKGKFAEKFLNKDVGDEVVITDSSGNYVYEGEEKVLLMSTGMGLAPNISIKNHIQRTCNEAEAGVVHLVKDQGESCFGNIGKQIHYSEENAVEKMVKMIDEEFYDKIYFCGNSNTGEAIQQKAEELDIPMESVMY